MKKKVYWLVFVLAAFLCGCGSGTNSTLPPSVAGLFEVTAVPTKSVFSRDEHVIVKFTVKNVSGSSVTALEWGPADYGLDVSQNGRQVGPASHGDGGTNASLPVPYTYSPGQTNVVDGSWEQLDVSSTPVGPGTYQLIFWFQPQTINGISISPDAAKAHMAAQPVTITIQ